MILLAAFREAMPPFVFQDIRSDDDELITDFLMHSLPHPPFAAGCADPPVMTEPTTSGCGGAALSADGELKKEKAACSGVSRIANTGSSPRDHEPVSLSSLELARHLRLWRCLTFDSNRAHRSPEPVFAIHQR